MFWYYPKPRLISEKQAWLNRPLVGGGGTSNACRRSQTSWFRQEETGTSNREPEMAGRGILLVLCWCVVASLKRTLGIFLPSSNCKYPSWLHLFVSECSKICLTIASQSLTKYYNPISYKILTKVTQMEDVRS